MPKDASRASFLAILRRTLGGPPAPAILSAAMLGAYWFGGEGVLLVSGLVLPAALFLATLGAPGLRPGVDGLTGLHLRPAALAALRTAIAEAPGQGRAAACFAVEIDAFDEFRAAHDPEVVDEVLLRIADRLRTALRDSDLIARTGSGSFAVIPGALRHADLETCIQMSARIQSAVGEAVAVNAARCYLTASVGFALPRQLESPTAETLLAAAEDAAAEAGRQGPGTIRAYARQARPVPSQPAGLAGEVEAALEEGQITAWFKPLVCADTCEVAGFQALARWQHPRRGTLLPHEFLPAVAAAGRIDRLGQVVLHRALTAMRDWLAQGCKVPRVAVALGDDDLRDPTLPDRIRWELDRFDLEPERLAIEIRQSALMPGQNEMAARNIAALSELGVGIDLADFANGPAPIEAMRRFAVDRIRIGRGFVARIDIEPEQQEMAGAILSLAERLGLEVLAEGVETPGEQAMLAQLGCAAVTGPGISPPLPFEETAEWMWRHAARAATQRAGRRVM